MLLLIALLACSGPVDSDGVVVGSEPGDSTVQDTSVGATGDTATFEVVLPLDLRVVSPAEVPGVLHLVSGSGATAWSARVEGREIPAGPDGIAALVGFPQGSVLDVSVVRDDEVQEQLSLPIPAHDLLWTVDVLDPGRSEVAGGVLNVGVVGREGIEPEIVLLDGSDGDVLWWHPVDIAWDISLATPNAEGDGFVWLEVDTTRETLDAQMVELSLDGRRHTLIPTPTAHHMGIEAVDGRYALLAFEVRPDEPAPDGGTYDAAGDRLLEIGADGEAPTLLFSALSELVGERNDWLCEHSTLRREAYGYDEFVQWTHGNSLVYLPETERYLVYLRWVDSLVAIGRDGTLDWVLSGPWSDFAAPDGSPLWASQSDSTLWSHGHFTDAWEGGVLMYDNGSHSDDAKVVEVRFDETTWTAEVVATHRPPSEGEHNVLGDARRLPGGNVLISWTVLGLLQEQTPEGDVVWEAKGDPGVWFNRVRFAENVEGLVVP